MPACFARLTQAIVGDSRRMTWLLGARRGSASCRRAQRSLAIDWQYRRIAMILPHPSYPWVFLAGEKCNEQPALHRSAQDVPAQRIQQVSAELARPVPATAVKTGSTILRYPHHLPRRYTDYAAIRFRRSDQAHPQTSGLLDSMRFVAMGGPYMYSMSEETVIREARLSRELTIDEAYSGCVGWAEAIEATAGLEELFVASE